MTGRLLPLRLVLFGLMLFPAGSVRLLAHLGHGLSSHV